MVKRTEPNVLVVDTDTLQAILQFIDSFSDHEFYEPIKGMIEGYAYVLAELSNKKATIGRLQKLIFGASTEKTAVVIGPSQDASTPSQKEERPSEPAEKEASEGSAPKRRKGHGRNGADAYPGADRVSVPHPNLEAGDACPDCLRGTVYEMPSGVLVRLVGQAPVQGTVYELQKFRCHLCGKIFTAPAPDSAGPQRYDVTTGSIIGVLKYGSGMPFNRLERLQGSFGVPLPASTQWDIIAKVMKCIEPAYLELIRQAAQGDVLYNDDTTIKILDLLGKRAQKKAAAESDVVVPGKPERKGLFTSGVISTRQHQKIALFFSGRQHAGENLADVLAERANALTAPIQMCDGLSRNLPGELATIVANCLAHSRRRFADVAESFSKECEHVLRVLEQVYKTDANARTQNRSAEQRLQLHQTESGPAMADLHVWLNRQLDERLVEPNSGLGEAITYMLRHWEKLTLFLREPGAPLDNNICERALKKAILHRKNSLFYKSENGARAGDVFMSLIYTCELCGGNPFDYLTELQRHTTELAAAPQDWMPWNYRETLAAIPSTSA